MEQKGRRTAAVPLAIGDTAFLMREEMRSQRLALEFEHAELRLKDHGIKSTVVVFGSARVGAARCLGQHRRHRTDPAEQTDTETAGAELQQIATGDAAVVNGIFRRHRKPPPPPRSVADVDRR